MWIKTREGGATHSDDRAINERYARGEGRIVIETNREKLPGFVNSLKEPGYMDLRPFYQRRPRWNRRQQSLLIESFIMNIPVPPVFLYEKEFNSYEVMDGQQRITALRDFYENRFALKGLEIWPELNGRLYHNLPEKLKSGVDRRSITSIVLLKKSTENDEEASSLRELVFERLNTGGVALSRQEIRNALYQSPFNALLEEISHDDEFRRIWGIPLFVPDEIKRNPDILLSPIFKTMGDLEIILRFFALRHVDHYTRGMQGFLDLYMRKAASVPVHEISALRDIFHQTLRIVLEVFGENAFHPYDVVQNSWNPKPHVAFHDAVMIGMLRNIHARETILLHRHDIVDGTKKLFKDYPDGTFTGRGNTKNDIQTRIDLFDEMIKEKIY